MAKVAHIASVVGLAVGLIATGPRVEASPDSRYFASTGHTVVGPFLEFYQTRGDARLFGDPITDEMQENNMQVQYFERARFELHTLPETGASEVRLGLLGVALTRDRTFEPVATFSDEPGKCYVTETRHSLTTPFHDFWFANGGAEIFGYPISEQLEEEGRLSQYFERARLEYHPGQPEGQRVVVGLVGIEYLAKVGRPPSAPERERSKWRTVQRGTSSYYGAAFQGRRTSSGSPFDMHALTAASRVLPLGSQARVTNSKNGKWVVVTINDRGPWTGNRILDLSQEAFSRIAPLSSGVAWVEVAVPYE